jgi:hypothetical protein
MRNVIVAGSEYSYVVSILLWSREISSFEVDLYHRPVIFIGDLVRRVFSGIDPIGKELRIAGSPYTVIGCKKFDRCSANQDNFVAFRRPLSTGLANRVSDQYVFRRDRKRLAGYGESNDYARPTACAICRPDDFDVTASSILETINNFTDIPTGYCFISSISLVVGGIVVMNIMMVS